MVWAESAVRDVEGIAAYLPESAPGRATAGLDRLLRKAESLAVAPMSGHVVADLARLGIYTWREAPAWPYRVFYRIAGRDVIIAAVLDGRRDLADLLLERLLRPT